MEPQLTSGHVSCSQSASFWVGSGAQDGGSSAVASDIVMLAIIALLNVPGPLGSLWL